MELGGKSPAIVLPGADLKLAANNVRPLFFDDDSYELRDTDPIWGVPQLRTDLHVN